LKKISKSKIVSAEEAVSFINSGDRLYVHANCSYPALLMNKLCERKAELHGVKIFHLMTFDDAPYLAEGMEEHFHLTSLFTGHNVRKHVYEGRADFVPVFLSEIPLLIERKNLPIDVTILHLSPPDGHGYCSFGLSNECSKTAAENSRMIIAQINPNMPRALGDNFIHIDRIDYAVEVNEPVSEFISKDKNVSGEELDVYRKIGMNITDMINDGDTLQMGIGLIPDIVLQSLKDKKDLGIHTEMFSDNLIDLIDEGIVNGEKKTFLPGKIVTSFVLGSKKSFEYINNNPVFEFRPTKFVNDPFNISRNDNMVSINSAIEIDLTGQVCADSIGCRNYSGLGGQLDFVRGASRSRNGRSFIAMPSTAKKNTVSKIKLFLNPGAGVTTTRGDVHYVVTEYGIADLKGKTIRERVKSLIKISHPDFREELEKQAREARYL
jgi:4-hydroxybutyrate CoA-transferase